MKKSGLDATDIRILSAVQESGRLSKVALAEKVNLSPSPCWSRLKKLEQAGYIGGYHADIQLDKIMDFTKVVVTVSLENHRKQDFEKFESYLASVNEVVDCVATGGGFDYVMTVLCSSLACFQKLMDKMVVDEIGIDRYITYIVTREVKRSRPRLSSLIS